MHAMWLMIGVLCVLAIAYRFYSKFIAAKVLALDDTRATPAFTLHDGHNYHPTNKWVLFGHHFAAISGAGPLIGPVLAAQFGYLPGLLWILIGVVIGGAVQDFVILGLSIRREGKSLAHMAYDEIDKVSGLAATLGILFVLVVALAGLGMIVKKALGGEKVNYPVGTRFVAPAAAPIIKPGLSYDRSSRYRIPAGTTITYPGGTTTQTHHPFMLDSAPKSGDIPVELDVAVKGKLPGSLIEVKPDTTAEQRIPGSAWGTFTIALTIPIALFVGWYMYRFRKGKVIEASVVGGLLTLGAVYLGSFMNQEGSLLNAFLGGTFNLSEGQISLAMALYGFIASVLPVWLLLCPRDYLSSFLKIGTVALLIGGVILANPVLRAPALNGVFLHGGPIVSGSIFPFVFITIMCGAISGFHSLVSSGTTPKMISKESHARAIGYGAMLVEGLVGIVALIAAASLPSAHYYDMNTAWKDRPAYQRQIAQVAAEEEAREQGGQPSSIPPLATIERQVGETLQGRTGGAVTLAVGIAEIFDEAVKKVLGGASQGVKFLEAMIPFWYHFAIMFEALFILTTIDTGTRVGRFLLQEIFGKIHPRWGKTDYWPSAIVATGLLVLCWWYFLYTNNVASIWPMFGIANQLLAVMALGVASVILVHQGKGRYAWITLVPMAFVTVTTLTAAAIMLRSYYATITAPTVEFQKTFNAWASSILIVGIVVCTLIVLLGGLRRVVQSQTVKAPAGLEAAVTKR